VTMDAFGRSLPNFTTEFKLQIPAGEHPVKIIQTGQRETRRQGRQRGQAGRL
jgi:hypothetical protein